MTHRVKSVARTPRSQSEAEAGVILPVHERVRAHVMHLLATLYSLDGPQAPVVVLEYPPNRELGDLGTPVAFELARRLRKAPRTIAQEIAGAFGSLEGVTRVAAAPNGYLNFFLERRGFLLDRLAREGMKPRPSAAKAIVEHTAINPNWRTSATCVIPRSGTLVRCCASAAFPSVQNYIDDPIQVADRRRSCPRGEDVR
jgi:arginyl-tRNA synthetase